MPGVKYWKFDPDANPPLLYCADSGRRNNVMRQSQYSNVEDMIKNEDAIEITEAELALII